MIDRCGGLLWPGYPRPRSVWSGLDELLAAHSHDGLTEISWLDGGDQPAIEQPTQAPRDGRGWPLIGLHDPRD